MLLERAEIVIREGLEEGFSTAMKEGGIQMLASVAGVISVNLGRGVENPEKFLLLVEWESLDAHVAYNNTPVRLEFRALVGRFSKGGAMEHFNMGDSARGVSSRSSSAKS